jgi:hypothetical protein
MVWRVHPMAGAARLWPSRPGAAADPGFVDASMD